MNTYRTWPRDAQRQSISCILDITIQFLEIHFVWCNWSSIKKKYEHQIEIVANTSYKQFLQLTLVSHRKYLNKRAIYFLFNNLF